MKGPAVPGRIGFDAEHEPFSICEIGSFRTCGRVAPARSRYGIFMRPTNGDPAVRLLDAPLVKNVKACFASSVSSISFVFDDTAIKSAFGRASALDSGLPGRVENSLIGWPSHAAA